MYDQCCSLIRSVTPQQQCEESGLGEKMETRGEERLEHMQEHKLSSGDQRENVFRNGDPSCQKDEISRNASFKIPFEDKQTEVSGKSDCNVKDFQDTVLSGGTSPGQSPYCCTVCNRSFNRNLSLLVHQRSHRLKEAYKCEQCGKCFSRISVLNQHQVMHRRESVFECTSCGDRFTHRSSLIIHCRTHKREKPFVCTQCSLHFSSASELVAHLGLHA